MNELRFTLLPLGRPSPKAPEGISASAEVGLRLHRPLTTPAGEAMVTGLFYRSLRALHSPIDARFPSVTAVGLSVLQAGFW